MGSCGELPAAAEPPGAAEPTGAVGALGEARGTKSLGTQ